MLVPSAVLPMPGRPARIRRSEGCRPPSSWSISVKPEVTPEIRPPRACAFSAHFHRAAQRLMEIERAFAIFAGLADGIERLFRFLDLGLRAFFGGRLIGGVDDILADADQAAPHRQIVQNAAHNRAHWACAGAACASPAR